MTPGSEVLSTLICFVGRLATISTTSTIQCSLRIVADDREHVVGINRRSLPESLAALPSMTEAIRRPLPFQ
jgi:hypothetical protein